MSKKANPTSIGLFFVVGLALAVAAVFIFSSRNLFRPQHKDILYFDASLKGLSPGAPVKYRGVTIGRVVEVLIRHNQASNDFSMPVIIAIDEKLAQSKSDQALEIGSQARIEHLIQRGLRGRLDAESLVTGVLYVALDIVPDAPPPVFHQLTPEYHEIPTVPSEVQRLLGNLAHLDLPGLSEKLNALLTRLDTSLSQLNVAEINARFTNLLGTASHLIAALNLTNLSHTVDQARTLLQRIDHRVEPLADSVTNTLFTAQKALDDLRGGLRSVANLLGPDSAFGPDLIQALEQLSNAGRAITDLAEFLERHPNALLTGRKQRKEQP